MMFGIFITSASCGFQVTTAVESVASKAPTMSASEVFTTLMSRSLSPTVVEAARQQVVRHRQLDEVDRLAL